MSVSKILALIFLIISIICLVVACIWFYKAPNTTIGPIFAFIGMSFGITTLVVNNVKF